MKIKFIALSLCMVASVNIIKAQDTDKSSYQPNNRHEFRIAVSDGLTSRTNYPTWWVHDAGFSRQPDADTTRTYQPILPLLRQPDTDYPSNHNSGRRTLCRLHSPKQPFVLQHTTPFFAQIPTGRTRIDLPSLLTNGTILPLPALRLPGFSNRLPHAKYRRIQASLFGTLRSRMETFSEERTNRDIGLL